MKNQFLKYASGLAVAAAVTSAPAIPMLALNDGIGNTVSIEDGGAGDLNASTGAVTFIGAMGNFSINVHVGQTKPILGSAIAPHMDLTFFTTSFGGGGTLILSFSDSGFTYSGSLLDLVAGTTGGSVFDRILVNGQAVVERGPFGAGSYNAIDSGLVMLTPDDILTLEVTIEHGNSDFGGIISSGKKEVLSGASVPDGGATAVLFGAALAGLGLARRKLIA